MQNDDAAGGRRELGLKAAMAAEEVKRWIRMGGGREEAEVKDTCSQGRRRLLSYIQSVT